MDESKIKKAEWESYVDHWHKLRHPIVPGRVSIARFRKLIKKYVKGKNALLLGATWQIRDMLATMDFHVTVVDISPVIIKAHSTMCKIKKRKEKLVTGNWLTFKSKKRFDLVIADAANFQFKESNYDKFFSNITSLLAPDGVSIQQFEGNHADQKMNLEEIVAYIRKLKNPGDYKSKAFVYLSYSTYKLNGKFGDITDIERDILPYTREDRLLKKKFDKLCLNFGHFNAAILPKQKIEMHVLKYLDIVDTTPFGNTITERSFYWIYVMKKKDKIRNQIIN